MPRQWPLTGEQRRLLRIIARMPLASAANLASILDTTDDRVTGMLDTLRAGGWVESVVRGMTERRQRRWFLTRQAVDELYVTGHQHPSPREEARAAGQAGFHPQGELPADFTERFALDHDHAVHPDDQDGSPFAGAEGPAEDGSGDGDGAGHEHPPWTATSRGLEMSLRRLAMLEPVYRLAPDLLKSGRVVWPPDDPAASRDPRMTDFRLLRHGGFYHAVARYGPDVWTPFTYAGHPRHRQSAAPQGGAPLLGRGLLFPRRGPQPAHRQPAVLRGPRPGGGTLGPGGGGRGRLGRGAGPANAARQHAHHILHSGRPVLPGGGAAALPGPGIRPRRSSHGGPARERPPVAAAEPGRDGHRQRAGPPAVPGPLPVPRHAGLPGWRRRPEAPPPTCAATWGGSWRPAWWRCSTGGTTCRRRA